MRSLSPCSLQVVKSLEIIVRLEREREEEAERERKRERDFARNLQRSGNAST